MKIKNISYNNSHIPSFRKQIAWLSVFSIVALLIGTLQSFFLIKANSDGVNLNTWQTVASFACLIICILFLVTMICEIIRYISLIKKINEMGNIESKSISFDFSNKFSFGNMFRLFQYIVLMLTSIFVVGLTTYSVLNYLYYTTINYYMPICLMLLVTSFYGAKMLEIQYQLEK